MLILTCSMVQSPSGEANWFAASQEIPRISRNPKVHYHTHKRTPPVSILGQPNQVHMPTTHLLEIHPNIIHPSTPRSPQCSPSLRFPHQDPIHSLSSPIRATCPAVVMLIVLLSLREPVISFPLVRMWKFWVWWKKKSFFVYIAKLYGKNESSIREVMKNKKNRASFSVAPQTAKFTAIARGKVLMKVK